MKKRPTHAGHMQLKEWKIEPTDWAGWVLISCPNCDNVAMVRKARWLHARRNRGYVARSCTYCFRVARVPE